MGGPKARGFTLIEVVVVIGVMAIISSLMLANFPRFNKQISVEREASKLALSLRKAQSYALAVREFNPAFNDDPFCVSPPVKFPGYGIFFKISDPARYFNYGDVNCDKYYGDPMIEEAVEIINIEGNVKFFKIKGLQIKRTGFTFSHQLTSCFFSFRFFGFCCRKCAHLDWHI